MNIKHGEVKDIKKAWKFCSSVYGWRVCVCVSVRVKSWITW
jgi:hypothetical protein